MVQAFGVRIPLVGKCQQFQRPKFVLQQKVQRRTCYKSLQTTASFQPPSLANTKQKFIDYYSKPIPAVYNTVLQELLAQAHFQCNSVSFQYDEVYALGLTSAFDQILDGYEFEGKEEIFEAFTKAVNLNPGQIRGDQKMMEQWLSSANGWENVLPKEDGSDGQQKLMALVNRIKDGKFQYSKFFAVGMFRILELAGAKDTKALEELVKALGVDQTKVNKDLTIYRNILSRMSAAKELMKEMLDRERKKQAERDAAKAEKKEEGGDSSTPTPTETPTTEEKKSEVQA
eukprot:TRINITY_DN2309_c1_g1_i1.p2 TRINITY_DN2309_c1_g1~~TRINITY_DN2309_c1_g1_i1.p2  ORF type:complete len:286 (-),score=58.23 TRINITY_DN2309_c1_g1_i1:464-1321(-)